MCIKFHCVFCCLFVHDFMYMHTNFACNDGNKKLQYFSLYMKRMVLETKHKGLRNKYNLCFLNDLIN